MNHVLWIGTELAYAKVAELEKVYLGVEPPERKVFSGPEDEYEDGYDIDFGVSTKRMGLPLLERVGSTAVLKVHGSLVPTHKWWHSYFPGEITSYEAMSDALEIAIKAEGVSKVMLDLSTNGGAVRGIDNFTERLNRAKKFVQVDAHTDSSAFSAGYWIGATATKLTASRMAEVGSIGTLMITTSFARQAKDDGVDFTVFRAGEFKAVGNPYEEMDEKTRVYLQENLEKSNQFFLNHVSTSRGLSLGSKSLWAEGKMFFAEEALSLGLIDQVITLDDLMGSGASQTPTSDTRRFEMTISDQKRAQIEAGANPEDVLTSAELKFYNAQVEAQAAEAEEATPEADAGDVEEEAVAASEDAPVITADMLSLTKEVGRLEAKLEASEALAESLQTQLQAKDADTSALMDVAQVALGKLFSALNLPKETPASATALVTRFSELRAEMDKRFKTGRTSKTDVEDPTASVAGVTTSFRDK